MYTWVMPAIEKFQTNSLRSQKYDAEVTRILAAMFQSVEPGAAVKRHLRENPLPAANRTFVFGLGKAACAMASALTDEIHPTDSLLITKHASPLDLKPATVMEGNHPVPGSLSLAAGTAALKFLSQLTADDLLICLISGGGSALMAAPRIPLVDLQTLTSALLACGARIDEINILRRHLDQLKGGGIVRHANGARVVSFLLSDVVGDPLEAIASGPTAPDPTTCADALAVIEKYDLKNKIPSSILHALTETLKPADPLFANVQNTVIASNTIALRTAQVCAQQEGFQTRVWRSDMQGEAAVLGREMVLELSEMLKNTPRPFCLLAGGEATVTLNSVKNGKGGRNQEFALGAVDELAGMADVLLISLATDGEDGPTDAAGAMVTGASAQRAESLGVSVADHLSGHDAYPFFEMLGDLVRTGPSGTNVNDIVLCFAF